METASKIVRSWLSNADEDLRAATALHELDAMKYLRTVPYLCHQSAEKSIKGYLAFRKVKFEKTHDLSVLGNLVLPVQPDLDGILKETSRLTIFAIQFRYPDAGEDDPILEDSKFAIRVAKRVHEKMLSLI